jgi:DNA-directed RNA polymerase subunit RPC12/RpoP
VSLASPLESASCERDATGESFASSGGTDQVVERDLMFFCPYCAARIWTDALGEGRCPSGAMLSRSVTTALGAEPPVHVPSAVSDAELSASPTRWFCPSCAGRMESAGTGARCPNCGYRLSSGVVYELVELNPHLPTPTPETTDSLLSSYWITTPAPNGPLGFGVTAHSVDDAISILALCGYDVHSVSDACSVLADVHVSNLDPHVRAHSGPIVVRGLWYPFRRVGL